MKKTFKTGVVLDTISQETGEITRTDKTYVTSSSQCLSPALAYREVDNTATNKTINRTSLFELQTKN